MIEEIKKIISDFEDNISLYENYLNNKGKLIL